MMDEVKLQDPRVVRVFISSPFNGMEKERDILTKFYWPKIEAALSEKGLHLRLVDMRWGITHSSSSDSQTINICLREIDRSDIFIGLYGQRYGWNGRHDAVLQENFDKAAEKYPWVEKYRDKSVTELEFMHGHLNNPGNIPACFCFRDKSYDDKMLQEAEVEGDTRKQRFYKRENENSSNLLQDLKERVEETESYTLGVASDYKDPEEGAEYIYNHVWKHIESKICAKIQTAVSDKEKTSFAHKAYLTSHCGMYIGGQKYMDVLDNYISNDTETYHPLTVIGPSGCGKTTLISNWLDQKIKNSSEDTDLFYYHFVGSESNSVTARFLLNRLIDFLHIKLLGQEHESNEKDSPSLGKLFDKLVDLLSKMQSEEHKGKRLVLVFDNINEMKLGKESMPLFWLPKQLSVNIKVIISITQGSPGAAEPLGILTEEHKTEKLELLPLTEEDKTEMCRKLLEENSKSMEHEQMLLITSSPKTNDPFFLKILINELCVAGRFRQLSTQITDLLQSEGVLGLIEKVLARINKDYSNPAYQGNVVEEVLCALCLCKQGISESEFPMEQHVWAPVIYALDTFLIDRGSVLGFSCPEMSKAVENLFFETTQQKEAIAQKVSQIFYTQYADKLKSNLKVEVRTALELLHLLQICGNRDKLMEVLSNIRIFEAISDSTSHFELNTYWQWLGTPADAIARRYVRSIDNTAATRYASYLTNHTMELWKDEMKWKSDTIQNLRRWFEDSKLFHGLTYLFDREMEIDANRPGLNDLRKEHVLCIVKYQKACFLSDTEKYKEALELHLEVLESRKKLIKAKVMDKEDIGMSYHGIGLCYYNQKNLKESEKWYQMSLEAQDSPKLKISQSTTYCNLGLISLSERRFDEALERFEKSNALRQEAQPNRLALETAYNYHNIGLLYRRKKDLDNAERYYQKALKVKEHLLGRDSYDVALSIMNIGTVEVHRKNHEKGLEYAQEALRIFEVLAPEGSYRTIMAKENVVNQMTMLNRYEEAEPLFKDVCNFLKTMDGGSANGLPPLHRRFIKWYCDRDHYEVAADIAFELVKCTKGKPKDFAYLANADSYILPEKRPKRPDFASIDKALKKWPTDHDLLGTKFDILIRESPDELLPFALKHCEESTISTRTYEAVADVLKDFNEDLPKAIAFLEAAAEKNPHIDALSIKLNSFKNLQSNEPNGETNQ